ncbi:MAG: hypothetical protein E5V56_06540 [Mesorhizobium sp.]|nr:MAG: hypothetical protein E5V56_06540 [Mesorhizobium sp.]TJX38969.1 MAG: hypothetical protein E5W21_27210 [Mesorhizobium sp.]
MELIRGHYVLESDAKKPSGGATGGLGACVREYAKQTLLGGREARLYVLDSAADSWAFVDAEKIGDKPAFGTLPTSVTHASQFTPVDPGSREERSPTSVLTVEDGVNRRAFGRAMGGGEAAIRT